jgi:hypothetical protein
MAKRRLLLVEWEDSVSTGGWRSHEDAAEKGVARCRSVGFVERDDEKGLVLSQTDSDLDNCTDQIAIPKGCIRRRRRLKHAL